MLAGTPPHVAVSSEEIRAARTYVVAPSLTSRVPSLPSAADAVYTKLTWREPTLRYRTPGALLADLDFLESGRLTNAERELGKR